MTNSLQLIPDGSLLNAKPLTGSGSTSITQGPAPGSLKSIKQGLESRFGAGPGSLLNAEVPGPDFSGSSLSYLDEVNEDNIEPPGRPDGSVGFITRPAATAALGQDQGSASHRPDEDDKSQSGEANAMSHPSPDDEVEANDRLAKTEPKEECQGYGAEWVPRAGDESAVEHIRFQLWDRRPVRGTPFRAKVEIRFGQQTVTGFINFTEARKWLSKRQDADPQTQGWYLWYRELFRDYAAEYGNDGDYRTRIGHMIKRPEWGKPEEQIPQSSGILVWREGTPVIILMVNDFLWEMPLSRSKHSPGPKTPGWFGYWQPAREDDDE
jgi:hypothetical protein